MAAKRMDPEYAGLPVVFEDVSTAAFRIRAAGSNSKSRGGVGPSAITKASDVLRALLRGPGAPSGSCPVSSGYESLSSSSDRTGDLSTGELYFKHEHKHTSGSFKERGALNALLLLDDEQAKRGVIAASAGNHALALALHGQARGIPVRVVMPTAAPLTKITKCRRYGANVILHGNSFSDAQAHARKMAEDENLTYVNGFDDPAIIAGTGTIGLEVLQQLPDVDAVLVPVGGGGLIAGVALAVKMLRPQTLVIGVEASNCASFIAAARAGEPVELSAISDPPLRKTLADGLGVPKVGGNAFMIAKKFVDAIVSVPESLIALSILRLLEEEKAVVEGGGATALAPLLLLDEEFHYRDYEAPPIIQQLRGKSVCVLLCGGNIDITVLAGVIDRGLAADGRLVKFEIDVSDAPGGLAQLTKLIADEGASIKDIAHERAFADTAMGTVRVRVIMETQNKRHSRAVLEKLAASGYDSLALDRFCEHVTWSKGVTLEDQVGVRSAAPDPARLAAPIACVLNIDFQPEKSKRPRTE